MAMQHTYNSALNASFIYKDSLLVSLSFVEVNLV